MLCKVIVFCRVKGQNYLEYCCRYHNGMVFKESCGEMDLTDPADIKEDACLLFYSLADKQVYKTEVYHNLKLFLVRSGFAVYLTGLSYEKGGKSHVVSGNESVFPQEDVDQLKTMSGGVSSARSTDQCATEDD